MLALQEVAKELSSASEDKSKPGRRRGQRFTLEARCALEEAGGAAELAERLAELCVDVAIRCEPRLQRANDDEVEFAPHDDDVDFAPHDDADGAPDDGLDVAPTVVAPALELAPAPAFCATSSRSSKEARCTCSRARACARTTQETIGLARPTVRPAWPRSTATLGTPSCGATPSTSACWRAPFNWKRYDF